MIYLLFVDIHKLKEENTLKLTFGAAYEDLKTHNKYQISFTLLFLLRRLVYVGTVLFITN